jgi:hypothetical protein
MSRRWSRPIGNRRTAGKPRLWRYRCHHLASSSFSSLVKRLSALIRFFHYAGPPVIATLTTNIYVYSCAYVCYAESDWSFPRCSGCRCPHDWPTNKTPSGVAVVHSKYRDNHKLTWESSQRAPVRTTGRQPYYDGSLCPRRGRVSVYLGLCIPRETAFLTSPLRKRRRFRTAGVL